MKEIIAAALLLSTMSFAAGAADGVKSYVGFELSTFSVKYKDGDDDDVLKNRFTGYGFKFGLRSDRFGGELFMKDSSEEKERCVLISNGHACHTEISYAGYGMNGHYYTPLADKLDCKVGLSLGNYKGELELHDDFFGNSLSAETDWTFGYGVDAGLVYAVHERADIEGGLRYVRLSDDDFVKHMAEMYVGARLSF